MARRGVLYCSQLPKKNVRSRTTGPPAAAPLVIAEQWLRDGKRVARVELVIPEELIERAVQVIRSRLRDHIDDAAGGESELGGHGTRLRLEFFHGVHSRVDRHFADVALDIVAAIAQLPVHRVRPAVDAD